MVSNFTGRGLPSESAAAASALFSSAARPADTKPNAKSSATASPAGNDRTIKAPPMAKKGVDFDLKAYRAGGQAREARFGVNERDDGAARSINQPARKE